MFNTPRPFLMVVIVFSYVLTGCSVVGPRAVSKSSVDYNLVLSKVNNEQLLLNLVRLRYRDTPFFMETASLSTGFSFDTALGATLQLNPSKLESYTLSGPNLTYGEKPTITYTPLQGDKFIKEMLSPMNLNVLMLLYHSGWSIERLLRVTIQRLNESMNAPTASGPTPDITPEYKSFQEIAKLFRHLQKKRAITLAQNEEGNKVFVTISPTQHNSSEVQAFLQALNLDTSRLQFALVPSLDNMISDNNQTISIHPRSMLASMYYLSQAVEVPQRDQAAGRVTVTRDESGEVFDWNQVTHNLFRVQSALSYPQNAYIAVKYRGAWFYIDDSDLDSKSTFSLLTQLLALQSSETKSNAPVLTIPVQ
ncbi:MAG: hypothetical protein HC877_16050 [Thioploca sp.]|nr:hypothetical protein [Thioploca sp.]